MSGSSCAWCSNLQSCAAGCCARTLALPARPPAPALPLGPDVLIFLPAFLPPSAVRASRRWRQPRAAAGWQLPLTWTCQCTASLPGMLRWGCRAAAELPWSCPPSCRGACHAAMLPKFSQPPAMLSGCSSRLMLMAACACPSGSLLPTEAGGAVPQRQFGGACTQMLTSACPPLNPPCSTEAGGAVPQGRPMRCLFPPGPHRGAGAAGACS